MRWQRIVAFLLVASALAAAVVYAAFPEWILAGLNVAARRAAGLERASVEVGDQRVVYLHGGSGPGVVVLLHGFGGNKDHWIAVAARLAADHRVIVPDVPGFGESPYQEGARYDPLSQATRIALFLAAIDVHEHHLGGLSMGGQIAATYAATFPERVRSLLVAAAPGVRSPERTDFIRRALAGEHPLAVRDEAGLDALMALATFQPPALPGFVKRALVRSGRAREAAEREMFDQIVAAGEDMLAPLLPKVRAPTLVLWGAEDRLVHPSAAGVFAASIADAESVVFPRCGHGLPTECAELVSERYAAFLAEHP